MHKTHSLFAMVLLALGMLALPGQHAAAQQYATESLTVTVTGNTTLGSNNSTTESANLTLTKDDDVAIYAAVTGNAVAQTGNVTLTFGASVDGTNYDPAFATVVLATSGNSTIRKVQNITAGSVGYLRLVSILNSSNGTVSNVVVKAAKKP